MTPSEKQKEIACAFADFRYTYYPTGRQVEYLYDDWAVTEEGKRLTAEPLITCPACEGERPSRSSCECCNGEGSVPDRRVIHGTWAVPEEKHRAAMEAALRNKSEESCIILLQKVVAQLDRIEGNMKVVISNDPPYAGKRIIIDENAKKL